MNKMTLEDCLYQVMKDGGWYSFWQLQELISTKFDKFYGEPTISAGLRRFRHQEERLKYDLETYGEVLQKRRRASGNGYEYKLVLKQQQHALF